MNQAIDKRTSGTGWSRKVLLAACLMLAAVMMAVSLLAPAPAQASAFPGANGKIVFTSDRTTGTGVNNPEGDEEIFTMNPDGTALKQLTKNNAVDASPNYSSDGNKIAFVSHRTGNFEVFVMKADGTGQTNLTKNAAEDDSPSFSPNGNKITFTSNRGDGDQEVFVMNSDGTGQVNLTSDPQNDADPTFSPDGSKIAFASNRGDGDPEVFIMVANGTQQTPLTSNDLVSDGDPSFSPDGSKIAFASNRDGGGDPNDFDIFVMNANGSDTPARFTNSRARDTEPAFSPDGKKVAYTSNRDGGDADIFVIDATAGEAGLTPLSANTALDLFPDWQPIAATFTVTSAADPGDGVCNATSCTLREAIGASNAVLGQIPNTIKFNIQGSGVQTITPSSPLPPITRPVVVDGYTQPGASSNTLATGGTNAAPKIELSGINTFGTGIALSASSDSVVRGLVINRFPTAIGIFDNFSGTSNTANNRIEGNFLGTDPSGKLVRSNEVGVHLDGGNGNVVGGTTPAARNLISANGLGIELSTGTQGNKLLGNLIGTTASGTAPLGNEFWGVALFNARTSNNKIGDGTAAGSNTIAFNERDGIQIDFGGTLPLTGNQISRNSIFSNGGLGIDLMAGSETDDTNVSTPNDGDNPSTPQADPDSDTGANDLQNKPVLSSAKTSSTTTTISATLKSTPTKTFRVQFFSNPSGNEGKKFIGQKSVTTNGSGDVSFAFSPASKVAVGQTITATAADPSGNTSEFSAPRTVAAS